ncbi:ARM repeat-containing protein [Fistulina hepatica ATCC 64428]|nr:ARM repeat-containing protein [Fistulina hepatica ATCC 64428]
MYTAAVEDVADDSTNIAQLDTFNTFCSFIKGSDNSDAMTQVLDSITSGFKTEVNAVMTNPDSIPEHKTPLELYAFLFCWFFQSVKRIKDPAQDGVTPTVKPKGKRARGGKPAGAARARFRETYSWKDQAVPTLREISHFLEHFPSTRIWTISTDRDAFIKCITAPAHTILAESDMMKTREVQQAVYKVICLAVKQHNHATEASINVTQSLQFEENLAETMADLLGHLANHYDYTQLSEDVLTKLSGTTFSGADTKGPRSLSRFLVRLSQEAPRVMLKQISVLEGLLDSEAYPIRMAMIEVLGALIRMLTPEYETAAGDERKKVKHNVVQLYDAMFERRYDISSYVRAKLYVILRDILPPFLKQRMTMATFAVEALEDKTASVRKNAAGLLTALIQYHPYTHEFEGELAAEKWTQALEQASAELTKIVEQEVQLSEELNQSLIEAREARPSGEGADDMEVDGENEDEDAEDEDDDEDEVDDDDSRARAEDDVEEINLDEDSAMAVDGENGKEATSAKKKMKSKKRKRAKKSRTSAAVMLTNEQLAAQQLLERNKQFYMLKVWYYGRALKFIGVIDGAVKIMCQLLASTSRPEVLQAIDFFQALELLQHEQANVGIRAMIHLIWVKDNTTNTAATGEDDVKDVRGVRSKLLDCYHTLYFDEDERQTDSANAKMIAKNMIQFTWEATLAELTSLEEMLRIMMLEGKISDAVIEKLWHVYETTKTITPAQRRGAILLLGMLATADRNVLNSSERIDTMIKIGLGQRGQANLILARYTCVALQRLSGSAKKVKGSLEHRSQRIPMHHHIFARLQEAIERPCRSKDWFGMAEQIINTVYALGEQPHIFCDELIKKFTLKVFSSKSASVKPNAPVENAADNTNEANKSPDSMEQEFSQPPPSASGIPEQENSCDTGDAFELSQLLFVVGHVAIKQLVFLELVEREWKRQKEVNEIAEKQAAKKTARHSSKDGDDLDQVVGSAEDEIADRVQAIREQELLHGPDSLLAIYGPMLAHICRRVTKYKNDTLRAVAILSFSKFLCISPAFCESNYGLLFALLEKTRSSDARSNIVIALGDVAVSFNHIIDENNDILYRGLCDEDLIVKKNTLMVLTHLILNGMIKVKGQLGEMAKLLEDPDRRIADLAKLFFTELATKENAIYNHLPDVISHLSIGKHAVDEEKFQETMKYVFKFIEKEKQAENIVEKLCQRFRTADEPRQWHDIAFCLSLLPYKSERSMKKLMDALPFYQDKLHDEVVFKFISEILVKARANKNKSEIELAEFAKVLEEHKAQGEEDRALVKRAGKKKGKKNNKRPRECISLCLIFS